MCVCVCVCVCHVLPCLFVADQMQYNLESAQYLL